MLPSESIEKLINYKKGNMEIWEVGALLLIGYRHNIKMSVCTKLKPASPHSSILSQVIFLRDTSQGQGQPLIGHQWLKNFLDNT